MHAVRQRPGRRGVPDRREADRIFREYHGAGKLSVSTIGPQGKEARAFLAKSQKSGMYDVKLDPFTSGKHRVSVKCADVHVSGSPFILKLWPGVDPSKCKAYGPGLQDGVVGRPSYFTIDTRSARAGVLVVHLRGMKNAFKINMKPADELDKRTMIAQYEPKLAGDYLISILWSEQHIPGSPFRVRIRGQNAEESANGTVLPRPSTLNWTYDDGEPTMTSQQDSKPNNTKSSKSKIRPSGSVQNMPDFSRIHTNSIVSLTPSSGAEV